MSEVSKIAWDYLDRFPSLNYTPQLKNQMHEELIHLLRGVSRTASNTAISTGYEAAIRDIQYLKDSKL